MKRYLLLILFTALLLPGALWADEDQPATWLEKGVRHGFFIAPVMKYSKIDGDSTLLTGGKVCWLVNHRFAIGFAGYGRVEDMDWDDGCDCWYDDRDEVKMGYGGLYIEAALFASQALHLSTGILIGAGVRHQEFQQLDLNEDPDCYWHGYRSEYNDVFLAIEPEINLEANITRYFSFNAGIGYRFASGVDERYSSNGKMSGMTVSLTLKFGML